MLAEVSQGQQMAATNLLEKAAVALHQGDRDKARAMVLRAQALGHDEHEDVDVCSWSAHMTMFNLVTDVLDESDDEWAWLDAAATVLPTVPEAGRQELVDVLVTISKDYDLDHIAVDPPAAPDPGRAAAAEHLRRPGARRGGGPRRPGRDRRLRGRRRRHRGPNRRDVTARGMSPWTG